jgi:hypothetical protein
VVELEECVFVSCLLKQSPVLDKTDKMADNSNANASISAQAAAQSISAQATQRASIFAGNDAKRMSFDGNLPQYNLSTSPGGLGLTSGLIGSTPNYNRDRRDSLKLLSQLQDFGTD